MLKNNGRCAAYILSGLLGNRAFSLKLADAVDGSIGEGCTRYWFDETAYPSHPAPQSLRVSSELETGYVARRFALALPKPADIFIINSHTLAQTVVPTLLHRWPEARFIVALDATPAAIDRSPSNARHGLRTLPRRLWRLRQHAEFARVSRHVAAWLPICEWVKQSLVNDYGVPAKRCHVTRIPQPASQHSEPRRELRSKLRLLFVGNDFLRKGGDVLIEVVRQQQIPCELIVVSNDPVALSARSTPGVTVVTGLRSAAEVKPYYAASDLLVLPTRMDCYPNVLCEALAHGLPFAATSINGIRELIESSGAGLSIDWPADVQAVMATLSRIIDQRDSHAKRSAAALAYSSQHLTEASFHRAIQSALDDVLTSSR